HPRSRVRSSDAGDSRIGCGDRRSAREDRCRCRSHGDRARGGALMDRLIELGPDFCKAACEPLSMPTYALAPGGLLGTLIGLGLYTTRQGGLLANRFANGLLSFVVNFFRPIPFVIFLAVLMPFTRAVIGTGIGVTAGAFAIGIAAAFAIG